MPRLLHTITGLALAVDALLLHNASGWTAMLPLRPAEGESDIPVTAVRAARAGFPLTAFQAYLLTVIAPILTATTGVAKIFASDGTLLKAGETFSNPDLAETIEWLAEDGARLFA